MLTETFELSTAGSRVVDVTDRVRAFARTAGRDGIVHVFVPHATAGLALIETGSGTEQDLEDLIERLLPRDARYAHSHGSPGHGGDHVLPALISPAITVPVIAGNLTLGTWQSVVLVDPNRDNDARTVRLTFLPG